MASIEYSLFRTKFIKSGQRFLFDPVELSPKDIFLLALLEKPSVELRAGYSWHIGNISFFSKQKVTGYFAIGRTTKSTIEKFDDATGNFVEEELDTSPYTHCVFNARIGILGIAHKKSLTPTVKGIAARIQQLLRKTTVVMDTDVIVEIAPIPDTRGFLHELVAAYRVSRFSATFRGPNPFDADELFQKPLSVYLASANGEKGRAQIQGEDLEREVIQSVTSSTAATGNEASATITKNAGQKPITIHLRGDALKRKYDEEKHDPKTVLQDLEKLYTQVRNNDETS